VETKPRKGSRKAKKVFRQNKHADKRGEKAK
jgi:hypothetical protein